MAGKKDFSKMETGNVYKAIEQGTSRKGQQGTASPEEAAARAEEMRTQGRKGCKGTRINMIFTPANHEFLRIMAKASGRSMTQTCNLIVAAYRNEHPEFMERAQSFIDFLNSGLFSSTEEK